MFFLSSSRQKLYHVLMLLTQEKSVPLAVILLGPPGSGKGTHAVPLSLHLGLKHISSGDLFREHIRTQTPLGKQLKSLIDAGKLVPDAVTLEMLFDRLGRPDCKGGVILDGFPRTVPQAEALEKQVAATHKIVVLQFVIEDALLIDRIAGRIACKDCGTPFHKRSLPPKVQGQCDICQGALYQRADDTEEILRKRLAVYNRETAPLIQYYEERELLVRVDSSQDKAQVFQDVLQSLHANILQLKS